MCQRPAAFRAPPLCVHKGVPQAPVHLHCPPQHRSATLTQSGSLSQEEVGDAETGQREHQRGAAVETETARKTEEAESGTEREKEMRTQRETETLVKGQTEEDKDKEKKET